MISKTFLRKNPPNNLIIGNNFNYTPKNMKETAALATIKMGLWMSLVYLAIFVGAYFALRNKCF